MPCHDCYNHGRLGHVVGKIRTLKVLLDPKMESQCKTIPTPPPPPPPVDHHQLPSNELRKPVTPDHSNSPNHSNILKGIYLVFYIRLSVITQFHKDLTAHISSCILKLIQ